MAVSEALAPVLALTPGGWLRAPLGAPIAAYVEAHIEQGPVLVEAGRGDRRGHLHPKPEQLSSRYLRGRGACRDDAARQPPGRGSGGRGGDFDRLEQAALDPADMRCASPSGESSSSRAHRTRCRRTCISRSTCAIQRHAGDRTDDGCRSGESSRLAPKRSAAAQARIVQNLGRSGDAVRRARSWILWIKSGRIWGWRDAACRRAPDTTPCTWPVWRRRG